MRKIKFIADKIYHIYNRGVEKRDIFMNDADRWRFIQAMFLFNDEEVSSNILWKLANEKGRLSFRTLREYIEKENNRGGRKPLVKIMTDCLMPNHFHFLIKNLRDDGVSRFMHKLGIGYTKYFNEKYNRVGSLFQGPFKAVPVENDLYLQYLLIYINVINPGQLIEPNLEEIGVKDVRKIMAAANDYSWSAHLEYIGKRQSIIIEKDILGDFFPAPEKYEKFAREILLGRQLDLIGRLVLEPSVKLGLTEKKK